MKNKLFKVLGGLVCVLGIQDASAFINFPAMQLRRINSCLQNFTAGPLERILQGTEEEQQAIEGIQLLALEVGRRQQSARQRRIAIERRRQNTRHFEVQLNPVLVNAVTIQIITQNSAPNYPEYSVWPAYRRSVINMPNDTSIEAFRQQTLRNQVQNNQDNQYNNHWEVQLNSALVNAEIVRVTEQNEAINYPEYDWHIIEWRAQPSLHNQVQNNRNNPHNNHWEVQLNPVLVNAETIYIITRNETPNYPEYSVWPAYRRSVINMPNDTSIEAFRRQTLRNQVQNNQDNQYNNHWEVQLNPVLVNAETINIATQNAAQNYPEYDMHSVDRRMQPTLAEQVQNNRNNQHNNHWIQQEDGRWTIQNNQD